jgi:hypothetical protein
MGLHNAIAFWGRGRSINRWNGTLDPDKLARANLNPGRGCARGFSDGPRLSQPPLSTLGFHRTRVGVGCLGCFDHQIIARRQRAPFAVDGITLDLHSSPPLGEFFAVDGPCMRLLGASGPLRASLGRREQDQRHQSHVRENQPDRDRSHGKTGQDHQHYQRNTPNPRGYADRQTLVRSRWRIEDRRWFVTPHAELLRLDRATRGRHYRRTSLSAQSAELNPGLQRFSGKRLADSAAPEALQELVGPLFA